MRGAAGCENSASSGFLLLACRDSQIGCPCVDEAYLLTTAQRAADEMAASNAGPAQIICYHTAKVARERKRRTAASYLSKWINVHHKSPKAMPYSQKAKKKKKRLQHCCASGKWAMASRTLSVRHSQSAICPPSLNPFMIHRETDSKLAQG